MIAPTNASFILITFTELSTQPGKDFVRVFQCADVSCSQQQQLAELSGLFSTQQAVTSTTGYMKVVFTSDGSVNYDGFNATWMTVVFQCNGFLLHQSLMCLTVCCVSSGRQAMHARDVTLNVDC